MIWGKALGEMLDSEEDTAAARHDGIERFESVYATPEGHAIRASSL